MRKTVRLALITGILITAGLVYAAPAVHGQASRPTVDPELVRLRHNWAMRFMEPGAHMELAKYFRAKGDLIQAFYILENARRGRFEGEVFDAAFLLHFGGFAPLDNSKAEEEKYLGLRRSSPNDVTVIKHLADIYVSRDDFARAEPLLKLVLEKTPEDFSSVAALATMYNRLQNYEKEKRILGDFESKYPTAAGSYSMRIGKAMKDDVAGAKSLLAEALKKYPNDGDFWYLSAVIAEREDQLDAAALHYAKAAELAKDAVQIQGMAARFFRNKKIENERALQYYLKAYFLDPHAHFDGFAEARIRGLNSDIAKSRFDNQIKAGIKPEALLDDPNPMVVGKALEMVAEKWDGKNVDLFVGLMRHDEVMVRWWAMQAIIKNEGRKFDPLLRGLLNDSDLRVRGLAAYMAVYLWKNESFPEIRKLLEADAQVLRFDAVSALLMAGGPEGKKVVFEHLAKERHEYLRNLIKRSLAKEPS